MIIESGVLVACGLLLTFYKCPWSWRMAMLSNPLFMDVLIFTFLTLVHWGTFSGVMVASVGALVCSGLISLGRCIYGHIERDMYTPGVINVAAMLLAERSVRRPSVPRVRKQLIPVNLST